MNTHLSSPTNGDDGDAIMSDADRYYAAYPESPAAAKRPRIAMDGNRYVASLDNSVVGGIFFFGTSVASALECFDALYARCSGKL
jgi:hypothetical protein